MHSEKGMARPQLSLNMHPKWLKGGTASEFLLPLKELGLTALEFTLNLSLPDWSEMSSLIEECCQLGLQIHFHAPFKGAYELAGFSGAKMKGIKNLYHPAIAYAVCIAKETTHPAILVVHGAKGDRPRGKLRQDTEAFLTWILDEAPNLYPSLELLFREQDKTKIGDSKVELVEIVSNLNSPRAGICWDMGHDTHNIMDGGDPAIPPGFIPLVNHVHVHDIAPNGEDHCPLLFGNVPYEKHLRQLVRAGFRRTITLEVNGYLVSRLAAAEGKHPNQILKGSLRKLGKLTSSG